MGHAAPTVLTKFCIYNPAGAIQRSLCLFGVCHSSQQSTMECLAFIAIALALLVRIVVAHDAMHTPPDLAATINASSFETDGEGRGGEGIGGEGLTDKLSAVAGALSKPSLRGAGSAIQFESNVGRGVHSSGVD